MNLETKLVLSASRALWDIITPNVRRVSIDLQDNVISLHFYYVESPTENEIELSEEAATEVIADFPEPYLIDCQRHIVKQSESIEHSGYLVYSRYEKK